MKKTIIIFIILIVTCIYYFFIFTLFYDNERWAREFMYMRDMMEKASGGIRFDKEESIWEKYTRELLTDFRNKPKNEHGQNNQPWWKPVFSEREKMKAARFIDRFKGKGLWRKELSKQELADSISSFFNQMKKQEQKNFEKWLESSNGEGQISEDEALFYLITATEARRYHDFQLARKLLSRALEINKDEDLKAQILQELGYVEHETGNWKEAEKYFQDALKLKPEQSGFYVNLGWNYFLQRNFQESLKLNKIALDLDQEKWIPLYNVAISYLAMGEYLKAYEYYRNLSNMDLGENSYYYILEDLFILNKMDSRNKAIPFFIGYTYLCKKRFQKADEFFQKFLENNSGIPNKIVEEAKRYHKNINQ